MSILTHEHAASDVPCLLADDGVHSQAFDLLTATPEELTRELSQRVMKRLEERLKGSSDADPVRLGVPGYRARVYEQRFGATPGWDCLSAAATLCFRLKPQLLMRLLSIGIPIWLESLLINFHSEITLLLVRNSCHL